MAKKKTNQQEKKVQVKKKVQKRKKNTRRHVKGEIISWEELPMVEQRYAELVKSQGEEAAKAYLTDYTKDFIGATLLRWDEIPVQTESCQQIQTHL